MRPIMKLNPYGCQRAGVTATAGVLIYALTSIAELEMNLIACHWASPVECVIFSPMTLLSDVIVMLSKTLASEIVMPSFV